MTDLNRRLLDAACEIARDAGRAILEVYGRDDFAVARKSDDSPLTEADQVAHGIITGALAKLDSALPILSEESRPAEHATRRSWPRYWLVDPLDGTKECLKRNGEFTVNIALVDGQRAVLGAVHAPVLDRMYSGVVGLGAWRSDAGAAPRPIAVRGTAATPLRVVGSRSHPSPELAAYLAGLPAHEITDMGSSLKICLVAEGAADVYPRLGPTSEWDTAAAQAILESAGGRMIDLAGRPLRYNSKDDLLNPHFLAFGDHRRDWLAPIQNTRGLQSRN
ncbi:MAG TPA: 3'(2'),5'-bisphosphate nucleotidase CysQ [Gammaproteobacteria bacterium]|nr:3'(2'),5'-bisphosphate nucleotidase CysQ [Gammaproteobacteria bacterium]